MGSSLARTGSGSSMMGRRRRRHHRHQARARLLSSLPLPLPLPFPVLVLLVLALLADTAAYGWSGRAPTIKATTPTTWSRWTQQRPQRQPHPRRRGGLQCSGIQGWGRVGERYSWQENEWEVEVTVPVPPGTRKDEVVFKASPTSLRLGLASAATLNANATTPLLEGALKGRITMDGSYWSLEGEGAERAIKLLLEKKPGALENAWDWRRVLAEEPATESEYQEAERFDTKAYTRGMLGPEGIDMSLVDRGMFGAGGLFPNVTKETLQEYVDAKVLDDASGLFPKKDKEQEAGEGEGAAEEEEEEG